MGSANGKLVPTGGGDAIELPGESVLIGRRPSCDIRMDFQNISGHHCRLSFRDGFWFLEDLESQNGTKVSGTRILPRTNKMIQPGDLITIGKRDFVMDYVPGKAISPVVESAAVEDLTIPQPSLANPLLPLTPRTFCWMTKSTEGLDFPIRPNPISRGPRKPIG